MGIEAGTWFQISCDRCESEQPFKLDGCFSLYPTREEAENALDWYCAEMRDGKVLCDGCRLAPAGEESSDASE